MGLLLDRRSAEHSGPPDCALADLRFVPQRHASSGSVTVPVTLERMPPPPRTPLSRPRARDADSRSGGASDA